MASSKIVNRDNVISISEFKGKIVPFADSGYSKKVGGLDAKKRSSQKEALSLIIKDIDKIEDFVILAVNKDKTMNIYPCLDAKMSILDFIKGYQDRYTRDLADKIFGNGDDDDDNLPPRIA